MKISQKTLSQIHNPMVSVPTYNRNDLGCSIVHIGLGHFHRSHFLTYVDSLLNQGDCFTGVFEVDVVPSNLAFIDALHGQDWLYSVLSLGADGREALRINGPILGYENASINPQKVLSLLVSPQVTLITLTITEKGYYYDDEAHCLNTESKQVLSDLTTDAYPQTAVGLLSAALVERAKTNSPITIMSCDNIPENGSVLHVCVLDFCKRKYPQSVQWINENVSFPCTMVDRITPSTTGADIEKLANDWGIEDACPVHCEDFMQWVIEDSSSTDIPDFSKVGALFVDDVKPYELMKIRLLNGSHSALSYPAYLMGIRSVDEAAANPLIHSFIRNRYMEEITKTLLPLEGIDLIAYKNQLISRFSNAHIKDTVLRLASDGSKKIANAIIPPLFETIEHGYPHTSLIFALAAWRRFCTGQDEQGNPITVDDPHAENLTRSATEEPSSFLAIIGLQNLPKSDVALFCEFCEQIESFGMKHALERFLM